MPSWIIFAVIAGLASNAFNFLCRYFLRDEQEALVWAWFFETGRLIVFLLLSFVNWRVAIDFHTILLLLLVGCSELACVYLTMKMHQHAHLSISTILSRTRLVWIPIIAFIFLHEHLQTTQYLGIAILFLGLSIVVSPKKLFVDKGAGFANTAAIAVAINTVFLKAVDPFASIAVIMVAACLPSVVIFPFFMKNPIARVRKFSKRKFWLKISAIIIQVISAYYFLFALGTGEVSRVNAIYQGMLVTSVVAGILLLHEKEDILKKLVGAAITIIGVLLLA